MEANRRIGLSQVAYGVNVHDRDTLWSTSMAVARVLGRQLEYCYTGDALIMFFYNDGSYTSIRYRFAGGGLADDVKNFHGIRVGVTCSMGRLVTVAIFLTNSFNGYLKKDLRNRTEARIFFTT